MKRLETKSGAPSEHGRSEGAVVGVLRVFSTPFVPEKTVLTRNIVVGTARRIICVDSAEAQCST